MIARFGTALALLALALPLAAQQSAREAEPVRVTLRGVVVDALYGDPLANAMLRLEQVGYTPTTTLRDAQFTKKGAETIPIHGGSGLEGTTNIIVYSVLKTTAAPSMPRGELVNPSTDLTTEGYVVNYGTSFIMALQFGPDGPDARAFLTYSQSDDPSSPYYADQTRLFSDKQWRRILYREDDILADPGIELERVSGKD